MSEVAAGSLGRADRLVPKTSGRDLRVAAWIFYPQTLSWFFSRDSDGCWIGWIAAALLHLHGFNPMRPSLPFVHRAKQWGHISSGAGDAAGNPRERAPVLFIADAPQSVTVTVTARRIFGPSARRLAQTRMLRKELGACALDSLCSLLFKPFLRALGGFVGCEARLSTAQAQTCEGPSPEELAP